MQGWSIRDAGTGDAGGIADVFRRSSLSNDGDRAALLAHPQYLEWTALPGMRTRVAVDGGRVLGFASITAATDGIVELDDLFVDPDEMRRGIGAALVADAVALARQLGAVAIEVKANIHALAFYEQVGFVLVGAALTELAEVPLMRHELGLTSPG